MTTQAEYDRTKARVDELLAEMEQIRKGARRDNREPTATEWDAYDKLADQVESLQGWLAVEGKKSAGRVCPASMATPAADADAVWLAQHDPRAGGRGRPAGIVEGRETWVDCATGDEVRVVRPGERLATSAPRVPHALGEMIRAAITGRSASAEIRAALSENRNSSGGFLVPEEFSSRFIDPAVAKMVTRQLGVSVVPMASDRMTIARLEALPTAYWRGEGEVVTESDLTFGGVGLTARTCGVLVRASRELAQDAPNFSALIEGALATALALEWDRVVLTGSGSNGEPTGIANSTQAGLNTSTSIGSPDYDDLIDAVFDIRSNNYEPTGFVYHPRTAKTLAMVKEQDTLAYMAEPAALAGIPRLTTTSIPTTLGAGGNESLIVAGDFSQVLVGVRQEIEISISSEAGDAYSRNQVLIRALMRMDVALTRGAAFWVGSGVTA